MHEYHAFAFTRNFLPWSSERKMRCRHRFALYLRRLCYHLPVCLVMIAVPLFGQRPELPQSPQVQPDGRVTFRFLDPGAKQVQLVLEGTPGTQSMEKTSDGVWSITVGPLEPEYYGYVFRADGVPLLDPSNPKIEPNLLQLRNVLHVPGKTPEPWEEQDVPHGIVHHHFYKSGIIGDQRDFLVYTPPGYDPRGRKRYPVLYLLHGFAFNASSWTLVGRANFILDNLIAQGKARPMIVVMPFGDGVPEIVSENGPALRGPALWQRNYDFFTQSLLKEVIPQVESMYLVLQDRKDRAIAGQSMGGAETLLTGLNHLNTFGWVGAFSPGGVRPNYAAEFPLLVQGASAKESSSGTSAAPLHLLWISCGTEDGLIASNRRLVAWIKSQHVPVMSIETPGMHTWMVWRNNLVHFAPLLFQSK